MHGIDWLVLVLFLGYTLWDGLRHRSGTENIEGLLLAKRSMSWWAVGLSVMATQASAITFIGTTGLAFTHDMRFIQIYLGLPVAMIILSITLVPYFHKKGFFTAYEALEDRFGLRLRLVTSGIFLLSRGATLGFTIAAPAYVLALILEVPLTETIIAIGIVATIYTMFGGINGVIKTDAKQMILMVGGLAFCYGWMIWKLPADVSYLDGLNLAGATGKLASIDLSFDISEKYNLWSGLIAGVFLMLSYFGADQSQVQRYLTAKSLKDARMSLMMSAVVKVPMQFMILLLGVSLYIFYVFEDHPLVFMPQEIPESHAMISDHEEVFDQLHVARKEAAYAYLENKDDLARKEHFLQLDREVNHLHKLEIQRLESFEEDSRDDTNYIFPYFVLNSLPVGVVGLLIAAILAAALSSIDSMLNSLAASSIVDWYQRLEKTRKSDRHYMRTTRMTTAGWGIFATLSAIAFGETESIIELVNQIGSYFYGATLGLFMLIWVKRADERSALWGMILGMIVVILIGSLFQGGNTDEYIFMFPFGDIPDTHKPAVEYLWLNPLGAGIVLIIGYLAGRNNL